MRLLVVLDETPISRRAVAYVATVVGRRRGFRLCLVHFARPTVEAPQSHNGGEAERDGPPHHGPYAQLRRSHPGVRRSAQAAFTRSRTALRNAGVPATALDTQFFDPAERRRAASLILDLARSSKCDTIVVGRGSAPWLCELNPGDLAEELVRRGNGLTIWIVE